MSSTRHKSRRTLCQARTVRTCVHSVGMLCGYMPNSSLVCPAVFVTLINASDEEVMFLPVSVCLSVSKITQKLLIKCTVNFMELLDIIQATID